MIKLEQRLASLPSTIYLLIAQIDELKGRWVGGANLSPQILDRLQRSVLVTSTGASTRIEGAKLSDKEVEDLMRGLTMQKLSDRDAQEVRGYYEVLQLVFENHAEMPLSESLILQLHTRLLSYSEKDERHKGRYKTLENKVEMRTKSGQVLEVLFDTTPPYLTPKAVQELVEQTNEALHKHESHPLLVVANFVVEFLKIHPFLDGNGRLSRVLTNLLLLRAGYVYVPYVSHEKLVEDNKTDYYIALRQSQVTFGGADETIALWTAFFLKVLAEQAIRAVALLSAEEIERTLSPMQLRVWNFLGTTTEATPGEIAATTGVARPTVSQALSKLMKLKRVERLGLGRTTRYRKL